MTNIGSTLSTVPYDAATSTELADAVAEVREVGVRVVGVVADARVAEDAERAARAALSEFGKIDILVTSAGVLSYGNLWMIPTGNEASPCGPVGGEEPEVPEEIEVEDLAVDGICGVY